MSVHAVAKNILEHFRGKFFIRAEMPFQEEQNRDSGEEESTPYRTVAKAGISFTISNPETNVSEQLCLFPCVFGLCLC